MTDITENQTWQGEGLLYKNMTVYAWGNNIYQLTATLPTWVYVPDYDEHIEANSIEEAIAHIQKHDSDWYNEAVAE
jgi:hypothetical protein